MKRKRSSKKQITPTFEGYFPPEVVPQVLANLPVKSLLRFRCVSKLWHDIIDNPDFILMHLNHCNNNNREKGQISALELLLKAPERIQFTVRCSGTFRRIGQVLKITKPIRPCANIDGLILMRKLNMRCHFNDLRLWNPSIRKLLKIPSCPWPFGMRIIGFAPTKTDDYKVVMFSYNPEWIAVYRFSGGSWYKRDIGLVIDLQLRQRLKHSYVCDSLSTKGAAHWPVKERLDGDIDTPSLNYVLSFDCSAEKFSFMDLPNERGENMVMFVFLLGESLAVLGISPVSACIWVMDNSGGKEPWTKWYSGDSSLDEYTFFKRCEHSQCGIIFYDKKGGVFFVLQDEGLNAYNISSHEIQNLGKSFRSLDYMCTHVESLLLHKGFGAKL